MFWQPRKSVSDTDGFVVKVFQRSGKLHELHPSAGKQTSGSQNVKTVRQAVAANSQRHSQQSHTEIYGKNVLIAQKSQISGRRKPRNDRSQLMGSSVRMASAPPDSSIFSDSEH